MARRRPQGLGSADDHSMNLENPAFIDPSIDSRAVTFENPTGARGAGGTAHGGRKGAPNMRMRAGESVVLADVDGPGDDPPHLDDDPAGAARGHAVALHRGLLRRPRASRACRCRSSTSSACRTAAPSSTTPRSRAVQEGRGFNSYVPMPFGEHVRIVATNAGIAVDHPLLPSRLHALARSKTAPGTCTWLPAREPDGAEARLRHRRRARRAGSVPRLRDRRPRDRRGRLVRRGRGEGVPRRRRRAADDLRHRPRGLRRQRVGDGRAQRSLRRRAARDRSSAVPTSPSSSASTAGTCSTRSCSRPISGSRSSRSARSSSRSAARPCSRSTSARIR